MLSLHHLTLNTGDLRTSPKSEVAASTLSTMEQWLKAGASKNRVPLPRPLYRYLADLTVTHDHNLLVTVYSPGQSFSGPAIWPIVSFGVCAQGSPQFWEALHDVHLRQPSLEEPAAPWCAARLYGPITEDPDSLTWLADFERCCAWAWIALLDEDRQNKLATPIKPPFIH